MSTSLGDLLDTLVETARREADAAGTAKVRADAGTALGHVARALAQLRDDGISPAVGDIRERQVLALSRICRDVAASAPLAEARLTSLAAAAADTVAVLRPQTTIGDRWAAATAFIDAVGPLCDIVESGAPVGPITERLAEVRRHTLHAEQTAALQPPLSADTAVLDRPIPSPMTAAQGVDVATDIRESMAALTFTMRSTTASLSVADVLAVTFAAQSLSDAAQTPSATGIGPYLRTAATAADAWRAVRTTLTPFTDGSRHLHSDVPPVVLAAQHLHAALQRRDTASPRDTGPGSGPVRESVRDSIIEATQHLPGIADDLHRRAAHWAATGGLLAYACDLPLRRHTLAQRLAGRRPDGVIHADAADLQPVTDAVHNARVRSTELAGRARRTDAPTFPTREWAAHREVLQRPHTPAAISAAKQEAYRQLHATRPHHPSPHRSR